MKEKCLRVSLQSEISIMLSSALQVCRHGLLVLDEICVQDSSTAPVDVLLSKMIKHKVKISVDVVSAGNGI
jgi:hypothetical protein